MSVTSTTLKLFAAIKKKVTKKKRVIIPPLGGYITQYIFKKIQEQK